MMVVAGGHSLMRSDIMQENLDVNGNSIVYLLMQHSNNTKWKLVK